MKAAWFFAVGLLIAGGWLLWRVAEVETRVKVEFFFKRHWWVLPGVFIALGLLVAVLASFSIKVF